MGSGDQADLRGEGADLVERTAADWPELLPEYERLYAGRAYLDNAESGPVRARVRELAERYGVRDRRPNPLRPPAEPEQLVLAV